MAAKKPLKFFENKELLLPHTFWDDDESKELYGENWATGASLVKLGNMMRKQRNHDKCIVFNAEDDEDYLINITTLRQYWDEKRFTGACIRICACSYKFVLL